MNSSMLRLAAAAAVMLLLQAATAQAQTPKRGGILNFAVVAEPPTIDCHAVTTFAFAHPGRPQYSTLLKFSGDYKDLKIIGDLAESWEVAKDGSNYTFKLHRNVKSRWRPDDVRRCQGELRPDHQSAGWRGVRAPLAAR